MTKKSNPDTSHAASSQQIRLLPNQQVSKISKVEEAPKIHELQANIKELEYHIKRSNANKATESEGLKKVLLQSADCVSSDKDDITDIMAKEKQKSNISAEIQKIVKEIDSINERIKICKKDKESLSTQMSNIKTDIMNLQKDRL